MPIARSASRWLALTASACIVLAGCDAGDQPHAMPDESNHGWTPPTDPDCRDRASGRETHIAMDEFDPIVAIAMSAAADAADESSADILANYCLLDLNLQHPGKRCFFFLPRISQPGGGIYVCMTPDGQPTDIHLGE